jgi:5,5'-dehydrodivanillate O-demethylase oxygenase subunit
VKLQDTVSQLGQGAIVDCSTEHFGHSDVRVILVRKVWERELSALAEGRPLKQWVRPESQVTGL